MGFLNTLDICASALTAEQFRASIAAQNITHENTTRTAEGGPYRRKQVVFMERPMEFRTVLGAAQKQVQNGGVIVTEVVESDRDFIPVYDPDHPDANEEGYVMMPNVNRAEEQLDLMTASTAYNANLTAMEILKTMAMKTLELGK